MTTVPVRLREWESIGPADTESALQGKRLATKEARGLAESLARQGVLEVIELGEGIHVRARAHVGRIRIDPLEITIEPKLGRTELLSLVRYAYDLRNLRTFGRSGFGLTGELFQDLLCAQLLEEVSALVGRGLTKRYVGRAEWLHSPRGRIDVDALARRSLGTDATLPCRHHLRLADHLLNRVALSGVRLAAQIVDDRPLRRSLGRLGDRMATEVDDNLTLDFKVIQKAARSVDRLTTGYGSVLGLIELLLGGRAISLEDATRTALPGFLFDMNRFFQALIGKFLREHLAGFELSEEHPLSGMLRYSSSHNPNRRHAPTPRPDFLVMKGAEVVAILDAKYRDLWARELPREMLYQLAMYALSQPEPFRSTILYPTTDERALEARIDIADPLTRRALRGVSLRPVILGDLVRAIDGPEPLDARTLARALAGLESRAASKVPDRRREV